MFGSGSLAVQATRLNDPRLAPVQRQALAARIGRVQGNGHLGRVVAATKGAKQTAPSPSNVGAIQRSPDEDDSDFWESIQDQAADAWEAVSSTASGLWDQATDAVSGLVEGVQSSIMSGVESLQSGWEGLQTLAESAVETIQTYTQNLTQNLTSPFAALGNAIIGLNADALQSAWENITGTVGGAWEWIQGQGQGEVDALEDQWTGLSGIATSIFSEIGQVAQNLPAGLGDQVTAVWDSLVSNWNAVKAKVSQVVSEATESIQGIWEHVQQFSITELVDTVSRASDLTEAIQEAQANPEAAAGPFVEAILTKLEGAPAEVQTQAGRIIGESVPGSAPPAGGEGAVVMRSPDPAQNVTGGAPLRERASISEVIGGIGQTAVDLWNNLDLVEIVKQVIIDLLLTLLLPIGLGVDIVNLGVELYRKVQHFFMIGSLADIQANFSHLLDIPLIIWRHLNIMMERLYVWLFLAFVLLGGAAGAGATGLVGAIGGAIIGLTPGAAAGGAAGGLSGFAAGAGAGAAVAGLLGLGLLGSFIAAEYVSAQKAAVDLFVVTQTDEEQQEDYQQFIVSALGVAIATLLIALSGIATRFARPIMTAARRLVGLLPTPVQQFIDDFAGGATRRLRQIVGGGEITAPREREALPDKEGDTTPDREAKPKVEDDLTGDLDIEGLKFLSEFEDVPLGEVVGEGRYKMVYGIEGRDDLVIAIPKEGQDHSLVTEILTLNKLKEMGFPTVEIIGETRHSGQPAIVMKRYLIGSKDILQLGGPIEALNWRSLDDLNRIRQMLLDEKVIVVDLQFLVESDGGIVIADPQGLQKGVTLPHVDGMLVKTYENLLKQELVPKRAYSRAELETLLNNQVVPEVMDQFLWEAISRVGFLEEQGGNYFLTTKVK